MDNLPTKINTQPTNEILSDEEKKARLNKQHNFYTVNADRDGSFKSLRIKKAKIIDKLIENNFFRYDLTDDNFTFISINENRIKECSVELITDSFFNFIKTLEPCNKEVWCGSGENTYKVEIPITKAVIREALLEKVREYFSKRLLARLVYNGKIEIKQDEKDKMFLYYRNGYVEITQNGYILKDYSTLDKLIWESQVLDRDFNVNRASGMYEKFIRRIAGYKDKENKVPVTDRVEKRIESIRTMMGYALHNYFDYRLKCPIFTDERMSENGEPNGRTGKTLLTKALLHIKNRDKTGTNAVEINGKDFADNGKHKYEDCSISTNLVLINDIVKNYDIEQLFNDITESKSVNQKNKQPFKINTKTILSTNKTLKITGESAKDRVVIFEFSDFYNSNYTPLDEFNCWFFKDWHQDEWNKFDTYMIESCMLFLQKGIIEAEYINLNRREVIEHTSQEFVDFMTDFIESGQAHTGNDGFIYFVYDDKINKQRLFNAFTHAYPDYNNGKFKQKTFTIWLRKYSEKHDTLQRISKSLQTEGRSNGNDWVIFKKKD